MSAKLTPAQRRTLQWISAHEPVGQFPVEVNYTMVKKLTAMGLAETAGRENAGRLFGFTLYRVSAKGREALQ